VVDPATVVTTHLTEIVKDNMAELLSFAETQKLLDELDPTTRSWSPTSSRLESRWAAAAGAAEPSERAGFDPRPAEHPGGRFRGLRPHPQRQRDHRARARPARPPDQRHDHLAVRDGLRAAGDDGRVPVLLTSPAIRPYVRSIVERFRPRRRGSTGGDVAERDPPEKARIKTLGQV
jgi:flagellar biosynthesis protein FlhA